MNHRQYQKARIAMERAMIKADVDPLRPTYHFHAPSQWMNDPNGTLWREGFYEVFYQYNPYSDTFGDMHWGHARTRDFLTWEHLPIALMPREDFGETACWSGCCVAGEGQDPLIFYTSIHGVSGGETPNTIRVARGDREMIRWEQRAEPVLTPQDVPLDVRNDWRDPYIFSYGDHSYMAVGGVLNEPEERAVVLLFRAPKEDLFQWDYAGLLYDETQEFSFPECPNFMRIGEQWLLLISPFKPVEYFLGSFAGEPPIFQAGLRGKIDYSSEYYATNTITDPRGRTILFGWIRDFPKGRGWNGCLALPRELSLDERGRLLQNPIEETLALRQHHTEAAPEDLAKEVTTITDAAIFNMEILIRFSGLQDGSLTLEFANEETTVFRISLEKEVLRTGGINIPLAGGEDSARTLRLFTDRSVIELFVDNGRYCVTRVIDSLISCTHITLRRRGGVRLSGVEYWRMDTLRFLPYPAEE